MSVNEEECKKSIPDKHLEFRVQKPLPQISLIGANYPKITSENPRNTALARGAVLAAKNDEDSSLFGINFLRWRP